MPAILVITADALGQHLLDALLSLHGYDVIFAECGRQGLELFRFTSPDVVMLDLNIPDMKALTVLRQIRKLHAHQAVIVLTGMELPTTNIGCGPWGSITLLTKQLYHDASWVPSNACSRHTALRRCVVCN
jgi:DNA-binding response OmpR family regulator